MRDIVGVEHAVPGSRLQMQRQSQIGIMRAADRDRIAAPFDAVIAGGALKSPRREGVRFGSRRRRIDPRDQSGTTALGAVHADVVETVEQAAAVIAKPLRRPRLGHVRPYAERASAPSIMSTVFCTP